MRLNLRPHLLVKLSYHIAHPVIPTVRMSITKQDYSSTVKSAAWVKDERQAPVLVTPRRSSGIELFQGMVRGQVWASIPMSLRVI